MSLDSFAALCVLGLLLAVITFKQFSKGLLEVLVKSRSVSTVVLLASVVGLLIKGLHYTALAVALITVFLLKDLWQTWPNSDARRLHIDVALDQARFDPSTSIDIQFGNGTATHNAPDLLSPVKSEKMLIFPPSHETLKEMCG